MKQINKKSKLILVKLVGLLIFIFVFNKLIYAQKYPDNFKTLPVINNSYIEGLKNDWLIIKPDEKASVFKNKKGNELILSNGIISRSFRLSPNAATTSLKILGNQQELVRAIKPEAVLTINGFTINKVFDKTGFLTFTHDGSYPGDVCASTKHPGHDGPGDSQYKQWKIITNFYKWCKANGVYLRVPDYYYLSGSNQCGVGYRENNWSLPRRHQLIHTRQNIFDGTWESTPSMRWSFVPLAQYHGGGAAATIEPLHEHLGHYEMMLACNLGLGIQSALRGPRLYDTGETKIMVKRMVNWYKKYRDILESDIIHIRRADGRDIDYMMHVNPELNEKGFLLVFNPTDNIIKKKIKVPLYYTGLTEFANIRERENDSQQFKLNRKYEIEIEVNVKPNWYNWYVIE